LCRAAGFANSSISGDVPAPLTLATLSSAMWLPLCISVEPPSHRCVACSSSHKPCTPALIPPSAEVEKASGLRLAHSSNHAYYHPQRQQRCSIELMWLHRACSSSTCASPIVQAILWDCICDEVAGLVALPVMRIEQAKSCVFALREIKCCNVDVNYVHES